MIKQENHKKPIVISAWICAGKTYLTNKYDTVIELPSGDYKYILTEEQKAVDNKESLKSTKREINPAWPENYYDAILKEVVREEYSVILVAPCMPFEDMRKHGIEFALAYPHPTCEEEYMMRARSRGANEEFVKRVQDKIKPDFEDFLAQPNNKIILQAGEYLEDALKRVNIL